MRLLAILVLLGAQQEKKISDAEKKAAQQRYEAGMALMGKKDLEGAIKTLEDAVKIDPGHIKAHEALARIYASKDDRKGTLIHVMDLGNLGIALSPEMRKLLNSYQPAPLAGLRWLARHQSTDGRWSADGFGASCKGGTVCEGKGESGSDLRSTCLALLAFMGAGFGPASKEIFDQKSFGSAVKTGLQWVIKQQKVDGGVGDPAANRAIEDQALATLTLVEAYDLTALKALHEPAQMSVDYLLSQRIATKGWGPRVKATEADAATTGWALFALRSAKRAELKLPAESFEAELRALPESSLFGPAFLASDDRRAKVPTAAIQKISGEEVPEDATARDALKIFLGEIIVQRGDPNGQKAWKEQAKLRLIKGQRYDGTADSCVAGSWDPAGAAETGRGRVQTTALNLLSLSMEYKYANVFCAQPQPKK